MTMGTSSGRSALPKALGAVLASGVALGGLAVIAPDADATAFGQSCDLILNTDAPYADLHWDHAKGQMSTGATFDIPVYISGNAGGAVSTPFAPMSSASQVQAAAAGRVICVVGRHSAIINGSAGPDTIYGGAGDETINGGAGNDVIFGGGGDDVLIGKSGDDSLDGGTGNDILFGNGGRNAALTASDNDTLTGGSGDDLIRGDAGHDLLKGNDGADCLLGGHGADEVYGWNGDDTIGGGSGHDYLAGNDNNDIILGGKGNDTLRGNDGLDQIWGDSDLFDIGMEMTAHPNTMNAPLVLGAQPTYMSFNGGTLINPAVYGTTDAALIGQPYVTLLSASMQQARVQAQSTLATSHIFGAAIGGLVASVNVVPTFIEGDPLATSGNIRGPLYVPSNKFDTVNSSNVGGIKANFATADVQKFFEADFRMPAYHVERTGRVQTMVTGGVVMTTVAIVGGPMGAFVVESDAHVGGAPTLVVGPGGQFVDARDHKRGPFATTPAVTMVDVQAATSSGGNPFTIPGVQISTAIDIISVTAGANPTRIAVGDHIAWKLAGPLATFNHIREVHHRVPKAAPHFRTGHLEVAACNLDGVRMMDDPGRIDVPAHAFSGVNVMGLAGMHQSMVAQSSQGDLEVPLLNNTNPGNPGPSGAFVDWPIGVTQTYFNDDIRGGDSDDVLYGEAGHDTIWGDHGDDTVFGEGDVAAYVLAEAAFNVPANALNVGGVPTKAWSSTKRKLPAGLESQYVGVAGDDSLSGNIDDDKIEGGPGNDQLYGGPDDDHLIGDAGSDHLNGGSHWDACEPNGGFVNGCQIIL